MHAKSAAISASVLWMCSTTAAAKSDDHNTLHDHFHNNIVDFLIGRLDSAGKAMRAWNTDEGTKTHYETKVKKRH